MKHRIIPAIMSGGSGTRLWPSSTDAKPKQFHALGGDLSLIAETVARVRGETDALVFGAPIILCNAAHGQIVKDQLDQIGATPQAIVLEPIGRNTAATAVIAAALAAKIDPEAVVLLLPADHLISDRAAFLAAIANAAPVADEHIVIFGITPSRPETGYGYVKSGAALAEGVFEVAAFREKPNAATAQAYLESGGYAWNAGMFLFSPRVLLEEFTAAPDIRDTALAALDRAVRTGVDIALDTEMFARTPSQPLDIAVMEKTRRAAVAPCDIGWADIGSWDEIWRLSPRDADGNAAHGPVVTLDSSGNLLRSDGPKICVAGISDLIVVATADAVLIVPRDRAQDVKWLRDEAQKLD